MNSCGESLGIDPYGRPGSPGTTANPGRPLSASKTGDCLICCSLQVSRVKFAVTQASLSDSLVTGTGTRAVRALASNTVTVLISCLQQGSLFKPASEFRSPPPPRPPAGA
jgi:hypothetical protein